MLRLNILSIFIFHLGYNILLILSYIYIYIFLYIYIYIYIYTLCLIQAVCGTREARISFSRPFRPMESHQVDLWVRHGALQPEPGPSGDLTGQRTRSPSHLQNFAHSLWYRQVSFTFILVKYFGLHHAFRKINNWSFMCLRMIEENNGKAPLTYNRMRAIVKTLGPPKRPIAAPTMEDMKGGLITINLWKKLDCECKSWFEIVPFLLLSQTWRRLDRETASRNTRCPRRTSSATTPRLSERRSSPEENESLSGD